MYAAHAEQKRSEASQHHMENCLFQLESAVSDNDRLAAFVEIAYLVKSNSFTDPDRRTITHTAGLSFLLRLIKTTSFPQDCPGDLYTSIAVSLLSAFCAEISMVNQPEMRDFLPEINHIIESRSSGKKFTTTDGQARFEHMVDDSLVIVSSMTQQEQGIEYIMTCGTVPLLIQYGLSPRCQHASSILSSLGLIMKSRGDRIFQEDSSKFHAIMDIAVDRFDKTKDVKEKAAYAKIITSFLSGISEFETSKATGWVVKLANVLKKLILLKLNPDDAEGILLLVCSFVSAVGSEVLSPDLTGDNGLLKAVVARLSVEVYMSLDGIHLDNALDRYPKVDKVYKLLSDVVEYLASHGELQDGDSIIAVYRKLVDVSNTIMEFLCSVNNQEVKLPRNHIVVLISVRILAAMLTEITEDPTPQLLELLPFFNLLCQNVEYSDEVKMEVKNATQAALENIKLMGIKAIAGEEPTENSVVKSSVSTTDSEAEVESSDLTLAQSEAVDAMKHLTVASHTQHKSSEIARHTQQSADRNASNQSSVCNHDNDGSSTPVSPPVYSQCNGYLGEEDTSPSHAAQSVLWGVEEEKKTNKKINKKIPTPPEGSKFNNVILNKESIDRFKAFQTAKSKTAPVNSRQRPFSAKAKKKRSTENSTMESEPQSEHWKLMPDDVLSFLLPTYAFFLEHDQALQVMSKCDSFQTIVNFIERSISQLLESKSSVSPELVTLNALSVIEQVYSNSPSTAARLPCFQDLFEISVLSVPNLVSLPHPPPLVCLKVIEVLMSAYRLQMRGNKRNSSLPRLKHSQARLFKSIVEYLSGFYVIKQHKRQYLTLHLHKDYRECWPLAEEIWCGCLAGLCTLVRDVDDLQDTMVKSLIIPEFLTFLREAVCSKGDDDDQRQVYGHDVEKLVESMLSLLESCARGSHLMRELILQNHGLQVARNLGLKKLTRSLQDHRSD